MQKCLQHSLKNALIAALVENAHEDMKFADELLKKRPPSVDETIKVDRQCAEWGISVATYQFQEWMHLFNNKSDLESNTLPKGFFLKCVFGDVFLFCFFCAMQEYSLIKG